MRIKKNAGAKIATLLASLAALGGIWALVHENPPQASAAATSAAASATPNTGHTASATANSQLKTQTTKKHTRTHVS